MRNLNRAIPWFGEINLPNMEKVCGEILRFLKDAPQEEITLFLTSSGGDVAAGFAFLDLIRGANVNLTTVALGEVDSMAIIVFLAGRRRLVGPHTTMFFHQPRRGFPANGVQARTQEVAVQETRTLIGWYSEVVQSAVSPDAGLSCDDIVRWQSEEKTLAPEEMLRLGIAHRLFQAEEEQPH